MRSADARPALNERALRELEALLAKHHKNRPRGAL
jgi:hypothetical protein